MNDRRSNTGSSASSALAARPTRVVEWVRCGQDAGVDGLLHAQRIRAAGVLFVRVRDAMRWAMAAVPARADTILALEAAESSALVTQGAVGDKLRSALAAMRGARARRAEDSDVSMAHFVAAVGVDGWAGVSGVGAPAQGAAGPLSIRTLVGAARSVATERAGEP